MAPEIGVGDSANIDALPRAAALFIGLEDQDPLPFAEVVNRLKHRGWACPYNRNIVIRLDSKGCSLEKKENDKDNTHRSVSMWKKRILIFEIFKNRQLFFELHVPLNEKLKFFFQQARGF